MEIKKRNKQDLFVYVQVVFVHKAGWSRAQVHKNKSNEPLVKIGEFVSIPKKYGLKKGDEVWCKVLPNKVSYHEEKWFAVFCEKKRESSPKWKHWQDGPDSLTLTLPSTIPGSTHDGIRFGCWKCAKIIVEPHNIFVLKNMAVWTKSTPSSIGSLQIAQEEKFDEVEKCYVREVRCTCKHSIGSFYPERYSGSPENQSFPCIKFRTVWKQKTQNGDTPAAATVLLGKQKKVEHSIGKLRVSEEWELQKHLHGEGERAGDQHTRLLIEHVEQAMQAKKEAEQLAKEVKEKIEAAEKRARELEKQHAKAMKAQQDAEKRAKEMDEQCVKATKAQRDAEKRVKEMDEKRAKAVKQAKEMDEQRIKATKAKEDAERRARERDFEGRVMWQHAEGKDWIPYPLYLIDSIEKGCSQQRSVSFNLQGIRYEIDFSSYPTLQTNTQSGNSQQVRRIPKLVWECDVEGTWSPYPRDICEELEQRFRERSIARFKLDTGFKYEVDFQNGLLQVNMRTNKQRPIRRCMPMNPATKISTDLPENWIPHEGGEKYMVVSVSDSSDEWKLVERKLTADIPSAKLVKVERIQNINLWKYFCFHVERAHCLSGSSNVERVWHGTRTVDPKDICTDQGDGFMMQHSKQGSWGHGIYFAQKASYSHSYAHQSTLQVSTSSLYRFFVGADQSVQLKSLILTKLVVGEAIDLAPDPSLRMCPNKPNGNGRYDTVTGSASNSKIYIVYENGRAYPEYLVTYR